MKSNLAIVPADDPKLTACCANEGSVAADVSMHDTAACESQGVESEVNPAAVREHAYYKWEAAGCPCGNDIEFWLEAEAELRHGT
ncbi:MAG: DUF2934 domain-containing protein [Bdellovibrionales bacterium]|nr:DUF2934 domain-containing protein [Bdellovibrionales bacterium]